jgi:hypothetical protein
MDIKDFRKLVNKSPIKDKLNDISLILDYSHLNAKIKLNGIQAVYKFINDQVISWNQIESIPEYFTASKRHFESIKSRLISLTDFFSEINYSQFDNQWSYLVEDIKKQISQGSYYVFLIDSPETVFLLKTYKKNPNSFQGAVDFLTNSSINLHSGRDYLEGALYTYEFRNQNESDIVHRRTNERLSLNQIREKYNQYIVEAEQHLNGYLADTKENLSNHFETVTNLKQEKEKNFDEWFKNTEEEFDNFYTTAQESIITNETLYREKLRLEAPADYWKKRAVLLKAESNSYMKWLVGVSVLSALFLFTLLMTLGTGFFETAFSDTVKGIKWSIILITLVSFLAFAIKILAKMTFSSLHLSRDAEEREQLTHFYLALKKDTSIEPEERQLILQSLFSRADTGLLKEDSSPTMPSSFVDKFTGK